MDSKFIYILMLLTLYENCILSSAETNNSNVWRVAGIQYPVFMTYDETETQITGGKFFPLFKIIQDKLKFSYFVVHPIDNHVGYINENGTWIGLAGKLANQEADISAVGIGVTYERFSAMDYSSILTFSPTVFIIAAPDKLSDWNSLTKPFSLEVWIAVFFAVFIFGLALHIVLQKELISASRERWTRCQIFWNLFSTFFGQGLKLESVKKFASRFMIGIWWFSIVVLICGYSGALMSFMTCPLTEFFPRNYEELAVSVRNGEYSCGTDEGLGIWKDILESKTENAKILRQNIIENNNFMDMKNAIVKMQKERFAYIMGKFIVMNYVSKQEMHKYFMSTDSLRTYNLAYAMKKNFLFKKNVSNILTRLFEAGIIEKLFPSEAEEFLPSSSEFQPLSIEDIKSPLLFMGIGYLLSLICFTIEIIYRKLIFCNNFY